MIVLSALLFMILGIFYLGFVVVYVAALLLSCIKDKLLNTRNHIRMLKRR